MVEAVQVQLAVVGKRFQGLVQEVGPHGAVHAREGQVGVPDHQGEQTYRLAGDQGNMALLGQAVSQFIDMVVPEIFPAPRRLQIKWSATQLFQKN